LFPRRNPIKVLHTYGWLMPVSLAGNRKRNASRLPLHSATRRIQFLHRCFLVTPREGLMMGISSLPQDLQQRLQSELKMGESIAWAGQPNAEQYMKSGFKIWFFFVPWTAFSLFWIAGAFGFRMPRFDSGWSLFPLFGLPFLFIGLAGLSAPFWMRRSARSIVYAVTNQRAISISGTKTISVKSYLPSQLGSIERTERQNGAGDLILRLTQYQNSRGNTQTQQDGFYSIENVHEVERLLEKLVQTDPKALN
jgi:hypothetical protein